MSEKLKINTGFLFYSFILFLICGLLMCSCTSTSSHRRGKLSDAMEKASDDDKEDRVVDTEPDPDDDYYDDEDTDDVFIDPTQPVYIISDDSSLADSNVVLLAPRTTWLTMAGGSGLLKKDDFYGLNHFNLALGVFVRQQHYLELTAGFGWAPVQEASLLNEALDGGIFLIHLGGAYRYYFTPSHTFMGFYLCAGMGYAYMHWSYKYPFEAMEYDEYGDELGMDTISSDGLSGFELYTGLGINLVQSKQFQFGAEALPGMILWGGSTSEGFDNDVIDNLYYTKFKIFIRFGW